MKGVRAGGPVPVDPVPAGGQLDVGPSRELAQRSVLFDLGVPMTVDGEEGDVDPARVLDHGQAVEVDAVGGHGICLVHVVGGQDDLLRSPVNEVVRHRSPHAEQPGPPTHFPLTVDPMVVVQLPRIVECLDPAVGHVLADAPVPEGFEAAVPRSPQLARDPLPANSVVGHESVFPLSVGKRFHGIVRIGFPGRSQLEAGLETVPGTGCVGVCEDGVDADGGHGVGEIVVGKQDVVVAGALPTPPGPARASSSSRRRPTPRSAGHCSGASGSNSRIRRRARCSRDGAATRREPRIQALAAAPSCRWRWLRRSAWRRCAWRRRDARPGRLRSRVRRRVASRCPLSPARRNPQRPRRSREKIRGCQTAGR